MPPWVSMRLRSLLAIPIAVGLLSALSAQDHTLRIPLPPELEREVRNGLSPHLRARLEAEARQRMAAQPVASGEDRILQFVDAQGRILRPELDRVRGSHAGSAETALTFTFESPAEPWTAEEILQIRADIQTFYPLIQAIIGPPAFSNAVNVIKDSKSPYAGWYNFSTNTLALNNAGNRPTLCHELVHAFRDDCIMAPSTFEEGMAKGVEVEVLNQLPGFEGTGALRGYVVDVHYELLNQAPIGAQQGAFFNGYRSPMLRYRLAGYAWGKVMIEWPTALHTFHRELYRRAAADSRILGSEPALSALAAACVPTIEGQPFLTWYQAQSILNVAPPTGDFLTLYPAENTIDAFRRETYGLERMYSDLSIHWTWRDSAGNLLGEGTGTTGTYGWVDSSILGKTHLGRTSLHAEATLPSGGRLQATAFYGMGLGYTDAPLGIFGVVTDALQGTVRITPLERPQEAVVAPLVDGAFQAPSLKALRGPCLLEFHNGNQRYTRRLTKDKGNYFVSLGPQPPAQGITFDSFSPSIGTSGTRVTLKGTGFLEVTSVTINGEPCAFSIESSTQITATIPPAATTGRIQIATRDRTVTSTGTFEVPKLRIPGTFTGCVVDYQRTFSAAVLESPHTATWTSEPPGLITPEGLFTAPPTPGRVTLRAVSTTDPTLRAELGFAVRGRNLAGNPGVDARDLGILARHFGATVQDGTAPAAVCDLNGDGVVDDADVTLFLRGF